MSNKSNVFRAWTHTRKILHYETKTVFLKTILDQNQKSLISKFFYLQKKNPTNSDWASTCLKNLEEMNVQLSLSEIREMHEKRYKEMIRKKCTEFAFKYLISKRGKKGKEIEYRNIEMAQYLLPNNQLNIKEQTKIFEMRNKMTNIPSNFTKKETENKCKCGENESMEHIYSCKTLNRKEIETKYENVYRGNVNNLKKIVQRFEETMLEREKKHHVILNCDPPASSDMRLAMDNKKKKKKCGKK